MEIPAYLLRLPRLPLAATILLLATIAAFANSLHIPFYYDDIPAIRDNPTIRALWPLDRALSPPSENGVTVNGRPLLNFSFALNYALGGNDVRGYHAVNIAIHFIAGLLLFLLVTQVLGLPCIPEHLRRRAWLLGVTIATLWLVHPLQTEAVTYIVQRAESLAGLFFLLSVYCFVRGADSSSRIWFWLCLLSCLLGMATKEVAAMVPLVVLLLDRAYISGGFVAAWRRHRFVYMGFSLAWVFMAILILAAGQRGGTAGFGLGVSPWSYALTQCFALGRYLWLSAFPSTLVFDYGSKIQMSLPAVLPQGILIVGLLVVTVWALVRYPKIGFLSAWFFVILAPSSSFLPIVTEPVAEHRMYLPLVAPVALFVVGMATVFSRWTWLIGTGLALALGFSTIARNGDYRDELAFWLDNVAKRPSSERAHNNVGEVLFRRKDHAGAIAQFREAVRYVPRYFDALNNLGNALTQSGRPDEALTYLAQALALKRRYAPTRKNIGDAFYSQHKLTEAVDEYLTALAIDSNQEEAHNNLGVALVDLGRVQEAIGHYEIALRLKPNYADAHYNFANALRLVGRTQEAEAHYDKALQINPDNPEAHSNLGGLLFAQGKVRDAIKHFQAALRLKPNYPDAHNNLGVAWVELGKLEDAKAEFREALRLNPNYVDARNNLTAIETPSK
jgi:protein O-mannosyl-transferase